MDRDFDQEKILDKMRALRDARETEIADEQFHKNRKNSEEKVLNVKYLGQMDTIGDVYLVIEQLQDKEGNVFQVERYETEVGEVIGGNNKSDGYDFILLSEKYKGKDQLLEQLQRFNKEGLLDLNEMEQDRLEAVAKALGMTTKDLKKIVEIDADKEIETKEEREAGEEEEREENLLSEDELESTSSKTEIDVNQKVTDSETMASLLKVQGKGYQKIQVIESDNLEEGNSTRFSFVGIKQIEKKDPKTGKIHKQTVAEKIDTLEQRYGQSPNKGVDSLNRDGSQLEEKKMQSIYQIKGDNENQVGIHIGSAGTIEVSYIRTPRQDNGEAISIPIETHSVRPTTREAREFMNRNRNTDVEEETNRIEEYREAGCDDISITKIKDNSSDVRHIYIDESYLDKLVDEILERYDELGETYNREDIKDKIEEMVEQRGQIPEREEIIEEIGSKMMESARKRA